MTARSDDVHGVDGLVGDTDRTARRTDLVPVWRPWPAAEVAPADDILGTSNGAPRTRG